MKSKGIQLSQLSPDHQRQASRLISRQLGAGNGETVRPVNEPNAPSISRNKPTVTWFRATLQGVSPVEVTLHGSKVQLPNGQMELINHPGWQWFSSFIAADSWVTARFNARRDAAIHEAEEWERVRHSAKYEEFRKLYNGTCAQLDQHAANQ